MGLKMEAGRVLLHEIPALLKRFGVEIPEEISFPVTFKLDEKHALHVDLRGYITADEKLQQTAGYHVIRNQVVQLEKD